MYIVPQFKSEELLLYLRKSQTDDPLLTVEEVLEKHEQMLKEWLEKNQPDCGPVAESQIFREIGSGETIASRPAMKELLRLVESPKIKAIMVTEPSRLSRGDLEDIGKLVKILRWTGTLVITLGFVYDLTDEGDRDRFERELMRGNEYLEYTKKIRMNGRLASVKSGNYIGQVAPYGYKKIEIKEGRKKCHTLEPVPEHAAAVRRIFELYSQGVGCTKIADQLDKEHFPAPKGERWSAESLPAMLNNVHYLGKVKWNERPTRRRVEDGEVIKSRPKAEQFLIFEGKHEAIIDQELWDRVQAIRGKIPKNKNAGNLFNPLAGLVWCTCGRAMIGRKYNDKNGKERCAPRLLCGARRLCGNASAKLQDVMDEVVKVLERSIEDFEIRIQNGADDSVEIHRQLVERLEKRLAELRALEKKQWDEKIKGEIPQHIFQALNGETLAEIDEIKQALCEAQDAVPEPINLEEKVTTFKEALRALRDPEAPVKEKNILLKACIERIDYKREKYTAVGTPKGMVETPIEMHFTLRV